MAEETTSKFEQLTLGKSAEPIEIESSSALRAASLAMVRQARATVDIVSRHLDPAAYDDPAFAEALRGFALRNRRSRVRLLIQDPAPMVSRGHRLVELVRQLTSFMEIRVPARHHASYNSAFLLADRRGVVFRLLADRYDGVVSFNDPQRVDELLRTMDEMWEAGGQDPNLRALHI